MNAPRRLMLSVIALGVCGRAGSRVAEALSRQHFQPLRPMRPSHLFSAASAVGVYYSQPLRLVRLNVRRFGLSGCCCRPPRLPGQFHCGTTCPP
jgi:hypothetical protein